MRHVLPRTWEVRGARVAIGGVSLQEIAARSGTPVLVTDERHVLDRMGEFRSSFGEDAVLVYAGKAFLCGALVARLRAAGWWIDVVSTGELEIAMRGGMPAERTLMHGNAKPRAELAEAIRRGVGRIVVDHPGEIAVLAELAREADADVPVLLRLNADVAAVTHDKVKTTGAAAQFGMDLATAAEAVAGAASATRIELAGVHIHVGSQIRDLDTFARAAAAAVDFVEPLRARFGGCVDLDLGGGMPVPYLRDDPDASVEEYARAVLGGLDAARAADRLGDVRLFVEPGRSVVATSTVTLYQVEARKRLPDGREMIAVDGGLSDNPRPSLYGQHYEVLSVDRADEPAATAFHVVGRHCETGDVINPAARLPDSIAPGDLIAVAATGAYAHSMSSRYNGLRRPPVVYAIDGVAQEVVRRETMYDLWACDLEILSRA